jgi:hypothetical protein
LYHGTLNFESSTDDLIDSAQLLPYPSFHSFSPGTPGHDVLDVPMSTTLTEFHFILLYKDRVVGVCALDEKLVYEESLPLVSYGLVY